MPNPRFKSENYENFGGINRKTSAYLTDRRQVLDLVNWDFSTTGAWTMRPGSTQYFGLTLNNLSYFKEYIKTSGLSQIMMAPPGGLFRGFGNTIQGISLGGMAATYDFGVFQVSQPMSFVHGSTYLTDSLVYRDWYVHSDGNAFLKYNGTSIFPFGLPYVDTMGDAAGGVTTSGPGFTPVIAASVYYKLAFRNNRGAIGPINYLGRFQNISPFGTGARLGTQLVGVGGSVNYVSFVGSVPSGYGISSVLVFRKFVNFGSILSQSYDPAVFNEDFPLLTEFIPGGVTWTFTDIYTQDISTSSASYGQIFPGRISENIDSISHDYYSSTALPSLPLGESLTNAFTPNFVEIYADRIFFGGFTTKSAPANTFGKTGDFPNLLRWSEIDDMEKVLEENSKQFTPKDGDQMRGLKNFTSQLVIFFKNSVHALYGNSNENFIFKEVSTEYGCLNHRSSCVFGNFMWFLDRKGIVQYDGSSVGIISDKVEDYFSRMNVDAAAVVSSMLHVKERNEAWCAIPIDGSSSVNIVVVYDYEAKEWTTFAGWQVTYMDMIKGRNTAMTPMYSANNRLNEVSPTYFADNSTGISTLMKSRYEHPMGQSTEKMFRRLFINMEKISGGVTTTLAVTLRQDYQTTVGATRSLVMNSFQKVTNFGLPGKSLSTQVEYSSLTERIRIYGYTLEYRYLRST